MKDFKMKENLEETKNNELIQNKKEFKDTMKAFQKSIIDFCINSNGIQNEESFFGLDLKTQFKFNECVDNVTSSVKEDFVKIENFYENCKNLCLVKFPETSDNLEKYNRAYTDALKPSLHPCLYHCVSSYYEVFNGYSIYMTKKEGMFIEFI